MVNKVVREVVQRIGGADPKHRQGLLNHYD